MPNDWGMRAKNLHIYTIYERHHLLAAWRIFCIGHLKESLLRFFLLLFPIRWLRFYLYGLFKHPLKHVEFFALLPPPGLQIVYSLLDQPDVPLQADPFSGPLNLIILHLLLLLLYVSEYDQVLLLQVLHEHPEFLLRQRYLTVFLCLLCYLRLQQCESMSILCYECIIWFLLLLNDAGGFSFIELFEGVGDFVEELPVHFQGGYLLVLHSYGLVLGRLNVVGQSIDFLVKRFTLLLGQLKVLGDLGPHRVLFFFEFQEAFGV